MIHISRKNLFITLGIVLFISIISIGSNSTPAPKTVTESNQLKQDNVIAENNNTIADTPINETAVQQPVNENSTPVEQKTVVSSDKTTTPQYTYYSVVEVVDGDTLKINISGKTETLRLIGLDTPETVDPRKPVQCFGREASNKAKELLSGKKVRIEKDSTQGELDKYGRTLAYVYREDGLFYNKYMIEQGYAHEYTYSTPYKYQAEFKAAEKSARENQRGLWSPNTCNGITTTAAGGVTQTTTTTPPPATTGKYYTSSHYSSKYYYPEACSAWHSLSPSYLKAFNTLEALLAAYPSRTLSSQCQ
jgi:endonuclease YncB( thermonuclease family)